MFKSITHTQRHTPVHIHIYIYKKKEYWSGLSCPPEGKGKREEGSFFPGDVRNQLASLVLAGGFFTTKPHGKLY